MLSILTQWNRWGSAKLDSGHKRDITQTITPLLHTKEVIALIGLRRAGKSTVLYQLMDQLISEGVSINALFHMNFEEPAISPNLSTATLDQLYRTYREEIFPSGKAYLFFDEIQNVPQWEKWVRARNESEEIKIFITGSSASLMSRELATVLTGRHVTFHVTPFNFKEILKLKNITLPKVSLNIDPPPDVQHALKEYMTWGGFPEIVLSEDINRRRLLLKQYFDDLLFKDIAMRHQIRDITALRNIAIHLVTQTGCLFSINRIANLFQISLEMASSYCEFIQESFLVDYLPFFSLKTAERNRNPRKIHVNDLGLRQIASVSLTPDYGKTMETIVYQHLRNQFPGNIFYWKGRQEVDFVIRDGNTICTVVQATYDSLENPTVLAREYSALEEAQQKFKSTQTLLVTGKMSKNPPKNMIPLWRFLLET